MKELLIVVPYRNRETHLATFLEKTPRYFNQQSFEYDILICELDQQGDWNAGLCCNSVIDFINNERQYKYIFVQHVDVFPVEGKWEFPNTNEVFNRIGDYGSCMMTLQDFLGVNGYSNSFWGWGGEDNDIYIKIKKNGIVLTEKSEWSVKFDTSFQNHQRKFNGENYANTIKNLYVIEEQYQNNITNFHEHGYTKDLQLVAPNIYRHIVVPKKTSPSQHKNNKVILTFSQNVNDFEKVAFYVKSCCIFAAYEYDVVVILGDEQPNERYKEQIEVHGAKTYIPKFKVKNLFVDRFACYKEFLNQNPQYEYVIHTDLTDVFFQANPFDCVNLDKLTVSSENIKIKNENWNKTMMNIMFPKDTVYAIEEGNILCSGVIAAPKTIFIELCNKIADESLKLLSLPSRGADQPILNKLIYFDKLFEQQIDVKHCWDNFNINLHAVKHNPDNLELALIDVHGNYITNQKNEKFAIVHQFNRYADLYNKVYFHYIKNYTLM